MSILLNNHGYDNKTWQQELSILFPEKKIHIYSETRSINDIADDIEYAVVWNHPTGDLQRYPNLKGILLLGAGTEHIDQDPTVPEVPVVRLIANNIQRIETGEQPFPLHQPPFRNVGDS